MATKRAAVKCATCGGTGKIFTARSWFPADGFCRIRCGICGGSGESNYRPDAQYFKFQKDLREATHARD